MSERIAISFRTPKTPGYDMPRLESNKIQFVIHEQPSRWFRELPNIACNYGGDMYALSRVSCPQVVDNICYVAVNRNQMGLSGYYVGFHEPHHQDILAMRKAIAALVNVARTHGYDFVLLP